jgi:hypothetical protein
MDAEVGHLLIVSGVGLVVVGAAMVWPSAGGKGRRARGDRFSTRRPRALVWTALGAGLIAAVEWLVLSSVGSAAVWALVLGLPALLAGATVVRLLGIAGWVWQRRQARPCHGRERSW